MKAVQFNLTIPRYLLGRAAARFYPPILWNGASCTYLDDVVPPALPGADWVRIRTRYGGICGSDLGVILLRLSLYYSPLSSYPFTFGHESVGTIAELGSSIEGWQVGERVVVEPTLWCRPRGFSELCRYCAQGLINQCERRMSGTLAPALSIGNCPTTGGSWSEEFVAHESQLHRVPESISDENALMIEPFACGLHAALQFPPADDETVLIIGAGTIGLVTLAALRATGSKAQIIVLARHPFQVEAAKSLGATEVILDDRNHGFYSEIMNRSNGHLLKPLMGKPVPVGGADRTYECVGTDRALDDAFRLTRPMGQVVLVGTPGLARGVDWTSIFDKELRVTAAYIYHHAEQYAAEKRSTFAIAIELLERGDLDLSWLITHKFELDDFPEVMRMHRERNKHQILKAVFAFEPARSSL